MPEYDDYEFNPENRPEEIDEPELQNQSWAPESGGESEAPKKLLLFILLAAFLLGIAGAWWWWTSFKSAAAESEPVATTAPERPVVEPPPEVEEEEDLSPVALADSDEVLRAVVSTVSSNPRLAAWLVNDGLIERFVKVTANVAYGEDPKSHVPFLRPGRGFEATDGSEGARVISRRSFARYTPIVEVMESVDAEGSATLFRRFQPAMEEAFSELGYPGTFKETLERAVERILAVKVPDGALEVEESVLSHRFVDPSLENAPDLDKLLYRMGPDNQRRLRSEVRRLSRVLNAEG